MFALPKAPLESGELPLMLVKSTGHGLPGKLRAAGGRRSGRAIEKAPYTVTGAPAVGVNETATGTTA